MSKDYVDDASRAKVFREVLSDRGVDLKINKIMDTSFQTDGHIGVKGQPHTLTECKNEWNNNNADPLLQAFMYYLEALKSGPFTDLSTRLPCLVIYYVGE